MEINKHTALPLTSAVYHVVSIDVFPSNALGPFLSLFPAPRIVYDNVTVFDLLLLN
jgi:hypothetical protein